MKNILAALSLALLFTACVNDPNQETPTGDIPIIKSSSTYNVILNRDITYAEGLSHDSINSPGATAIPLLLDAYIPDNDVKIALHLSSFMGVDSSEVPKSEELLPGFRNTLLKGAG